MENNKKNIQDFTSGSIFRQMAIFCLPLIASNLLQVAFNMSDVMVVGRFAGGLALGSVGSTSILVSLFIGIMIGISSGTLVKVAKSIGMQNEILIKKSIATSLYLCLFIGIFVSILGIIFARGILLLLGTKDELIDGAVLYLRIFLTGIPAIAVYNFGNCVYSASGNTKKPLIFLTIAGIVNVILNLVTVIILKMSVAGVALASSIGQYVACILIIRSLSKEKEPIKVDIKHFAFELDIVKDILALGIPAAAQNMIFCLANLFVAAGVNKLPLVMVQGNSAALNIDPITYQVLDAVYIATSTFIGQNYGAGKVKRVLESYKVSTIYSFSASIMMGIIFFVFGRQFLGLFTTEKAIVEAGLVRLNIMALSHPFGTFMDNTVSASRGLGKGTVPTIIIILGSCVFRILWVLTIFEYFGTAESLYLLYAFSWVITSIFEIWYFIRVYKKIVR